MKKLLILLILLLSYPLIFDNDTEAQFNDYGWKIGGQLNGVIPATEFSSDGLTMLGRLFGRFELSRKIEMEIGAGYGRVAGIDLIDAPWSVDIIPIDVRILYTPWELEDVNPYFYLGAGVLSYSVDEKTTIASPEPVDDSGLTGVIPVGAGLEIKLSDQVALDISYGMNYTLTDNLNYYAITVLHDTYFNGAIGISIAAENPNSDDDGDGLTNREEEELGTNPEVADTDGDGLNDFEEFSKLKTDPLNPDTDGDGLNDFEEVKTYKTNPGLADTDKDGLSDTDEVKKHKTEPTNKDTDGDGLLDGEEVNKYKTSPFKADTDMDGLSDYDEVMTHKTDPLNADSDGGSVQDGQEVKNGTNPNDATDDVPKPTEIVFEIGNIHFDLNKDNINQEASPTFTHLLSLMKEHPEITVKLIGHTCDLGSESYNMKLSEKRAKTAKEFLVKNGVEESRISLEWYGESRPIVPNTNEENRKKNRRVDVERTDKM